MWSSLQSACVSLARDGWHRGSAATVWMRTLNGRVVTLELYHRGDLWHPAVYDPHAPAIRQAAPVAAAYDFDSLVSDLTAGEQAELVGEMGTAVGAAS